MNVLFLMIAFPDIKKVSNFYSDLPEKFREKKHNVFVANLLEKKYNRATYLEEVKGINVLWIRSGDWFNTNSVIKKGLTAVTISNCFSKAIQKYFNDTKFDLVIYFTPPITFVSVIKHIKKKDECKSYIYQIILGACLMETLNMF